MRATLLATIIQHAAHLREESWDWPKYAKDLRDAHNKRVHQREQYRMTPGKFTTAAEATISTLQLPHDHYYTKGLEQAALAVCQLAEVSNTDPDLQGEIVRYAPLVANMLYAMWNDALSWAKDVLGKEPPARSAESDKWRELTNSYYATDSDITIPKPDL